MSSYFRIPKTAVLWSLMLLLGIGLSVPVQAQLEPWKLYPPTPIPHNPARNSIINTALISFRWDAGIPEARQVHAQSFQICVVEFGRTCTNIQAQTYRNLSGNQTTFAPSGGLPSRFQGKHLTWTVAACVPNPFAPYFPNFDRNLCQPAAPSLFTWKLPPPELIQPSGTIRHLQPEFVWDAVLNADDYLLCISRPGISCPTMPTDTPDTLVIRQTQRRFTPPDQQLLSRFQNRTVNWSAAACNGIVGCTYQQNVLPITFDIPSPRISLVVTPNEQTVQWGNGTRYQIEVQSQNNFNGMVLLELLDASSSPIPAGTGISHSFSLSSVLLTPQTPTATIDLDLTTQAAATMPGENRFRVRASSPGVTTRTENIALNVVRTPGAFVYQPTLSSATAPCGNNLANATFQNIGTVTDPDLRVTFSIPPGGSSNQTPAIPAVFYLFSPPPACVGVALHPLTGVTGQPVPPSLSWYNLGFSQNLGAPRLLRRIENLVDINWHQFWFSQDQTLLLLVTKLPLQTPSSPQSYRLFLFDAANGDQLDRTDILPRSVGTTQDPFADLCQVELNSTSDEVLVTFRNEQNQPVSCPLQQSTSNCQIAQPENCRITTRTLDVN